MNDAIMIGIGTVLADDPHLTCRLPGMERARRCASCSTRICALPLEARGRRRPRARRRLGVHRREGVAPSPKTILHAEGRRGAARRRRWTAGSISARCCKALAGARHHAADGRGRADGRGGLHCGRSGRRGGAVPLAEAARARASMRWKACRSTRLTQSPKLQLVGTRGGRRRHARTVRADVDVHRHRHRCRRSASRSSRAPKACAG